MKNRNIEGVVAYYECLFRVREHETLSQVFVQTEKHKGGENLAFLENW